MRIIRIMVALAVVVSLTATVQAGDELKIGTAGAQWLRIPVGSQGTALGGAMAAYATGVDALFWNPAGASTIEGTDLMFSHQQYIADINLGYIAAAHSVGDFGVIAASAKVLSMDDIVRTTVNAPDGDGTLYSTGFSVIGVSFAKTMTDRVSVGVNTNIVYGRIDQQTATGLAFDVGFKYNPGWNNLTFGAVVKNLGPKMSYDGPGFDLDTPTSDDPNSIDHNTRSRSEAFEIPSHFQVGAAWKLVDQQNSAFSVTGTFQSNNFAQDEYRIGGEYALNRTLYLRGGYVASQQEEYLYGASFGAGLVFNIGDTAVNFDYAWAESANFFDDSQIFTFHVSF